MPRVSPALLLIASGKFQNESEFKRTYAEAAREPVELWDLPDVNHTAAIRERAEEYERGSWASSTKLSARGDCGRAP